MQGADTADALLFEIAARFRPIAAFCKVHIGSVQVARAQEPVRQIPVSPTRFQSQRNCFRHADDHFARRGRERLLHVLYIRLTPIDPESRG